MADGSDAKGSEPPPDDPDGWLLEEQKKEAAPHEREVSGQTGEWLAEGMAPPTPVADPPGPSQGQDPSTSEWIALSRDTAAGAPGPHEATSSASDWTVAAGAAAPSPTEVPAPPAEVSTSEWAVPASVPAPPAESPTGAEPESPGEPAERRRGLLRRRRVEAPEPVAIEAVAPEPEPDAAVEVEHEEEPALEPAGRRRGLLRRRRVEVPEPEPAAGVEPRPEPIAEPEPVAEAAEADEVSAPTSALGPAGRRRGLLRRRRVEVPQPEPVPEDEPAGEAVPQPEPVPEPVEQPAADEASEATGVRHRRRGLLRPRRARSAEALPGATTQPGPVAEPVPGAVAEPQPAPVAEPEPEPEPQPAPVAEPEPEPEPQPAPVTEPEPEPEPVTERVPVWAAGGALPADRPRRPGGAPVPEPTVSRRRRGEVHRREPMGPAARQFTLYAVIVALMIGLPFVTLYREECGTSGGGERTQWSAGVPFTGGDGDCSNRQSGVEVLLDEIL